MEVIRKILFGVFETVAVVSFILLMCISDATETAVLVKVFCIFMTSALLSVFTDSPRRVLRYVLPFLICVAAIVHTIVRPIVKMFSQCYKMMRKSGSVIDCFYDCQENYDNWTDDNDKRKQRKQQAAKRAT